MDHRKLGATGLRVSALGFGTGAIGGLFVRGDRSDNWLLGAASDGASVWAVGYHGTRVGIHTLVEYVC